MAHYKKRPKVKRYRRSFYSREMRLKKGIGIAVLVLVILGVGWLAAPHVLDWATHTWYTVVRNRDLPASSVAESAASSAASSEAAASSAAEPEPAPEPEALRPAPPSWRAAGPRWIAKTLTDEAAIRAAAQQLAAQGTVYAVIPLKDSTGSVYYASAVPAAAGSLTEAPVDPARIASIFKECGVTPVAQLAAFKDPLAARTVRSMAIRYTGQEYLWLDNKASAGGNPWLNPYSARGGPVHRRPHCRAPRPGL